MTLQIFDKLYARGVIKIAIRCLLALLAIFVIVLTASGIILGSERGRLWLTETLIDQVNKSSDIHIKLSGLELSTWDKWCAQTIRIDRGTSPWLVAEQVEFNWQPLAIFNQTVIVDQLRATTFSVHKLIASTEQAQARDSKKISQGGIKALDMPSIQLKQLRVDTLNLYGFYASKDNKNPLSYRVSGEANWSTGLPLQLRLDAKGLNINPATLNVLVKSKDWVDFTLEGSLREPADGFLGSLLKLPAAQVIDAGFVLAVKKQTNRYEVSIQSLNFPIAKRSLSAQGYIAIAPGTATGKVDVYVDDLALLIDDTRHTLSGKWSDRQLDMTLNLTNFPLDVFRPWQPAVAGGDLTAQLALTGTIAQPRVVGNFTMNTVFQGLPIDVEFYGAISKKQIDIDKLYANLDKSVVTAKGKLDLFSDRSALDISVNNFNIKALDAFKIARPDNLNATLISAKGRLSGSARSLNGELTFSAKGDYEAQEFLANGQIARDESALIIKNAALQVEDNARISAKGNIDIDTLVADMLINMEGMTLTILKLANLDLPEKLSGQLQTQVTIKGDLRKPNIQGKAQLQGLYDTIPFLSRVEGHFQDKSAQIENLNLFTFGEEVVTATGHYQDEQFDLSIQAKKLPTQLFSAIGMHLQPGNFSAVLNAQGSLDSPELTGNLSYETILRGYNKDSEQEDIQFTWILDITSSDKALNLASTFYRESETPGKLLLRIPKQDYIDYITNQNTKEAVSSKLDRLPLDRLPINASITGNFNLQILSFLLDPDLHRLTGTLVTNIDLNGTLAFPIINGTVELQDSRYENPITGTLVEAINCRLNTKQIKLNFDICQATDGDKGNYSLTGYLNLPFDQSDGDIDLNLMMESANVLRRTDFESEATGDITLTGDFNSVLATGNLDLAPLSILLDSQFSSGIPSLRIEEVDSLHAVDESGKNQKNIIPDLLFDLTLTADRQAFLRGRGLEAELQGNIALYGSLKKPRYDGEIKTLRGTFELFNKPFKLESGLVNFANETIGLKITGVYEKNGQRIQAELSGVIDQLKLHLIAIPSMPEDEILAFVIFGKSIQKITPFEAMQLASAVQQLRGESSLFDPVVGVRNILGVDTLSVESVDTARGGSGLNVGVGKYLNERVYLEFERTPNPSQPWKGNIEIEVSPHLNLESSTGGQTGIEGVELKWKKDY